MMAGTSPRFLSIRLKPHGNYAKAISPSPSSPTSRPTFPKFHSLSSPKTHRIRPFRMSSSCSDPHSNVASDSSTAASNFGNAEKINYCQWCGGQTKHEIPAGEEKLRAVCTLCGKIAYQNPMMGNAKKINYCQWCGGQTKHEIPAGEEKLRAVCTLCGKIAYHNPKTKSYLSPNSLASLSFSLMAELVKAILLDNNVRCLEAIEYQADVTRGNTNPNKSAKISQPQSESVSRLNFTQKAVSWNDEVRCWEVIQDGTIEFAGTYNNQYQKLKQATKVHDIQADSEKSYITKHLQHLNGVFLNLDSDPHWLFTSVIIF